MSKEKDGGCAFPCQWMDFQPGTGVQVVREQYPGMSLRDWFAGVAMQGTLAVAAVHGLPHSNKQAAGYCYAFADAMLAEREKGAA